MVIAFLKLAVAIASLSYCMAPFPLSICNCGKDYSLDTLLLRARPCCWAWWLESKEQSSEGVQLHHSSHSQSQSQSQYTATMDHGLPFIRAKFPAVSTWVPLEKSHSKQISFTGAKTFPRYGWSTHHDLIPQLKTEDWSGAFQLPA